MKSKRLTEEQRISLFAKYETGKYTYSDLSREFGISSSGVRGLLLRNGYSRNKSDDLSGKKFHKLTVVGRSSIKSSQNRPQWACYCDCGSDIEVRVTTSNLKRGMVKSCGCIRKNLVMDHYLPTGEASFNSLFSRYAIAAKSKNREFNLSKKYFRELVLDNCHYCGIPPNQIIDNPSNNGRFVYNGIDRIDSSLGYVLGNVVSCCKTCNTMKGSLTQEGFIEHIKRIISFME